MNLCNSQTKLSKNIVKLNQYEKHNCIKCARCNCVGHNSRSCMINPIKRKRFKSSINLGNFREKEDLIDDLKWGELRELVDNHFED